MSGKIAVVDAGKNPQIYEIILKKENIEFSRFDTHDILKNPNKLNDFNILLLNIVDNIDNIIKIIKHIRQTNKEKVIVVTSLEHKNECIQTAISSGADDFLKRPINKAILLRKIDNYFSLIKFRKSSATVNESYYNLFTDKIFSRNIRFNINKEDDLLEFRDYFVPHINPNTSFCRLELTLSICEWLVKNSNRFFIVAEEDNNYYYITVNYLPIPKKIIHNIVYSHCDINKDRAKINEEKITIKIEKNQTKTQAPIQEQKKTKNSNAINAEDFLSSTPFEIQTKIDVLEDIEDKLTLEINSLEINNLEINKNMETFRIIGSLLREYSDIIALLSEFTKLSTAIQELTYAIDNIDENFLKEQDAVSLIISLLYSLVDDFNKWRMVIFINREAQDIHYLDDSMLASCTQIKEIISKDNSIKNESEYDDIEFF